MDVKFIADVNISPITISSLNEAGYDIRRVTKFLPPNSSDVEIINLAVKMDFTIITQDLDFSDLIAQSTLTKPSLITIRTENPSPINVTNILLNLFPLIEDDLKIGSLISVNEKNYRVRRIPPTA